MIHERPEPACDGRYLLFWSTSVVDHREAKKLCQACDMFAECQKMTPPPSEHFDGTWAGRLFVEGKPKKQGRGRPAKNTRVA